MIASRIFIRSRDLGGIRAWAGNCQISVIPIITWNAKPAAVLEELRYPRKPPLALLKIAI